MFFFLHKIWQAILKVMCCVCFQFWELIFAHHSHMLTSLFCSTDLGLCSCLMINRADLPSFLFLFYWNFICSVSGFHCMVHSGTQFCGSGNFLLGCHLYSSSLFLSSSKKEYTLHDVTVRGIMKTPLWLQRDVFRSVRHYSRSLGIGQWPALKQYCNMKTGQVWQAFQESPQINEGIYTRIGSWPLAGIDSWRWSSNSYIQRGTSSNRQVAIMLTL